MWVFWRYFQQSGKLRVNTNANFPVWDFPTFQWMTSHENREDCRFSCGEREGKITRRYLIRCYYTTSTYEATNTQRSAYSTRQRIFHFHVFPRVFLVFGANFHHSNLTFIWILRRRKQAKFNWRLKAKSLLFASFASTRHSVAVFPIVWSNGARKIKEKLIMRDSIKASSGGTSATFCFVMTINTFLWTKFLTFLEDYRETKRLWLSFPTWHHSLTFPYFLFFDCEVT